MATGIMIASAPIFLMKAESTATTTSNKAIWVPTPRRSGKKRLIATSTMPERATPALTTSALPTMMTISLLKPEKASLAGTTPIATEITSAQQATRS